MFVTDLVFPRRCPVCDKPLPPGIMICPKCDEKLVLIKAPRCYKCGRQVENSGIEYCPSCTQTKHVYDSGLALYDYTSVNKTIYRYKYSGRAEYACFLGREMAKHLGPMILSWKPDAIIPVPLHKSKERKRGFNQAALLAAQVSKALDIPYRDIIERSRKTTPMKELSAEERQINLKNAFLLRDNDVKLKCVVIVDDIYTTGSTIDAITSILKEAGVMKVFFIALSIGIGV